MAGKTISTEAAQRMNLVAQDEIWRYCLKAESEARKNWAQNWGFLATPLEELIQGKEEPRSPKPKVELPEHFHIRPVTPVEKYIKVPHLIPLPALAGGHYRHRAHRTDAEAEGADG
ncbi:uncharacterized protein C20orf85 homolog isoform X2 [Fukomys damarensis]|uniref:uncharacterized protein C20orf85 homolog isoform X2 n=1 Tax=Fukomys damarensis TaxID=885580 RepID=UPI00053FBF7C|nr:uncharacterized protein C20orf85 homolog isoform X2 [Fukomys damarensis]